MGVELLTPEEVAAIFKVKRIRTIYTWIADGLFPNVIVVRRQYRIPRPDVDALIDASKMQAGDLPPGAPPGKRRVISEGLS
jgi:excisionase family DNA binding protein